PQLLFSGRLVPSAWEIDLMIMSLIVNIIYSSRLSEAARPSAFPRPYTASQSKKIHPLRPEGATAWGRNFAPIFGPPTATAPR
uniref:hypothetical protein n=1 Tax=Solidesulfovibrio sp. TaxID=2910990 RepID=UPI0026116B27